MKIVIKEAQEAFPAIEQIIATVVDEPLHELSLELDYESWPRGGAGVLELRLDLDDVVEPARVLLAPYAEGATWPKALGIAERAPTELFASEKPRIDARFIWGDFSRVLSTGRDATDLGEQPLALNLELASQGALGASRELPSLKRLFERRASFSLWERSGATPRELTTTEVDLRLVARVRSADLFGGVCIWRSRHEHDEFALLRSPIAAALCNDIQREVWLGAFLRRGLRRGATSQERRRRLAGALDRGIPIPEEDCWAAFHLLVNRARAARSRRTTAEAIDVHARALSYGLDAFHATPTPYSEAFRVWDVARNLVALLNESGDAEALEHYANLTVELARTMRRRAPAEPDFARVASQALMLRAELVPRSAAEVAADLSEATAIMAELARARPELAWRREEATRTAERAATLWPKSIAVMLNEEQR